MTSNRKTARLLDVQINVKIKLSALWVALMFFYLYRDVLGFYAPGHLEALIAGEVAGKPITLAFYLGTAIVMAIPSVMVFLSLALKPKANRWANIIVGIFFTVLTPISLLLPGVWAYLYFYGSVEVVLTALIVWTAWKWPKQEA